jgi:hypothetical protein
MLADGLDEDESVDLGPGRVMSKQELYDESQRLDRIQRARAPFSRSPSCESETLAESCGKEKGWF